MRVYLYIYIYIYIYVLSRFLKHLGLRASELGAMGVLIRGFGMGGLNSEPLNPKPLAAGHGLSALVEGSCRS